MAFWEGYSLTPASNNLTPPNGSPEGMAAGSLNDSLRQACSAIREVGDMISGGSATVITAGGSYSMLAADSVILVNKTVGGIITINLVTATGRKSPVKIVDLKGDANTNPITIDANGAQTICGQLTYILNFPFSSVVLCPRPDGNGWYI